MTTPAPLFLLLAPLLTGPGGPVLSDSTQTLCLDADGDGLCVDADCDDNDASVGDTTRYYPDVDGDGYGDLSGAVEECTEPDGYTTGAGDCDDTRSDVNPLGTETCDGVDNDCDDEVDYGRVEELGGVVDLCLDTDADGLTDATEAVLGTNLEQTDTDLDGLKDGLELGLTAAQTLDGSSTEFVADADPTTTTDPSEADSDGDGLLDGKEDANHDGAVGASESDPNLADSDGGGIDDGAEHDHGTDPTDPADDNDAVDTGGDTSADTDISIDPTKDEGCGCATPARPSSGAWLGLLALLGLARRRRTIR